MQADQPSRITSPGLRINPLAIDGVGASKLAAPPLIAGPKPEGVNAVRGTGKFVSKATALQCVAEINTIGLLFRHAQALAACRTQDDRLQRWESGPYFAAFSLHIPDMRSFLDMREIVKICPRSPTVSLSNT